MSRESYRHHAPTETSHEVLTENPEERTPKEIAEHVRPVISKIANELVQEFLHTSKKEMHFTPRIWRIEDDPSLSAVARAMNKDPAIFNENNDPIFGEACSVFIEEIVRHTEQFRLHGDLASVEHVEYGIIVRYLSASPSPLFQNISIHNQFRISGFLRRQPGFDGVVERLAVDGAYDSTFLWSIDNDEAQEVCYEFSVEDQLDYLSGIEPAALATAGESYAEDGVINILHFLRYVSEASPYPLVQIRAEALYQKIAVRYALNEDMDFSEDSFEDPADLVAKQSALDKTNAQLQKKYGLPKGRQFRYSLLDTHHIGVHVFGVLQEIIQVSPEDEQIIGRKWVDEMFEQSLIVPFGERDKQKREAMLFQHLHDSDTRAQIESMLNISLEKVPLRSQVYLLRYIAETDPVDFIDIHEAINRQGIDQQALLNSFLACAEHDELGETILYFARTAPLDVVNRVLREYDSVRQKTDDIEALVTTFFKQKNNTAIDTRQVVQSIIRRCNRELLRVIDRTWAEDTQLQEKDLDLSIDISIFTSLFATIFKGKEVIDIKDVVGLDAEKTSSTDFSAEEWREMEEIIVANWGTRGAFGERVIAAFRAFVEKPERGADFYTLKKDNHIIAFVRYDRIETLPDGRTARAAKSLNVSPAYRGSAFSEALFERSLQEENKHVDVILGTVHPSLDAGTHYVEKNSFYIAGVLKNYAGSGEDIFDIRRDPVLREQCTTTDSKKFTADSIRNAFISCEKSGTRPCVYEGAIIERIQIADTATAVSVVERMVADGYIGTRYFSDPSDSTHRFYVFERRPPTEVK